MKQTQLWLGTFLGLLACCALSAEKAPAPASLYAKWKNGPPADASFFPIAVWLQNPNQAARYRDAGINTYVGLWRGPTEEQLAALKQADMKLICSQNATGLQHLDDSTIIGWMHGDEPDNAQALRNGQKGYGPPILPEKIQADYERRRTADPTRPVFLNLGQGVAWDNYIGRGVRRNHPEDYAEYVKGCDIASFDIYPVAHDSKTIKGNLWYVAHGVERLVQWAGSGRPVWNCIECTRIHEPEAKATPHQVRAEVWMSLVHGSRGIIYFVHEWQPKFNESALLSDPEMLTAVTVLNKQITELAPVLNSPTVKNTVTVIFSNNEAPVATMVKRHRGATWLFAVAMRNGKTSATFNLPGLKAGQTVEVLGEQRTVSAKNGSFTDSFGPWDVHLYRVAQR
jgi:hypothetical protein